MKKNNILGWLAIIVITLIAFKAEAQESNINLTQFDIVKKNNKVLIEWSIDQKSSTNYFELERSDDGENFKTVAYILGPDPSKSGEQFGCFDNPKNDRSAFYRLKHVAVNGETQLSSIKKIVL